MTDREQAIQDAYEAELARLRSVVEAAREVEATRFDAYCEKADCVECAAFRRLRAALAALDGER